MLINVNKYRNSTCFKIKKMQLTRQTLEQRINSADVDKEEFITSLLAPALIPGKDFDGDYYKYNTSDKIAEFYREKGVYLDESENETSVSNFFYTSLNKEPLQRVVYGIKNSQEVPDEIWPALTKWEAAYFLAGLWIKKAVDGYDSKLLEEMPLHLIIYGTIDAGARELKRIHNKMKEKGEYETDIQLPYIDELRTTYDRNYTRFINNFYQRNENANKSLREIREIRIAREKKEAAKVREEEEQLLLQPTLFGN